MKKIILFGAGTAGVEALKFFGAEMVFCFADNNSAIVGKIKCGKGIISFDELVKIHSEYYIVICANQQKSYIINEQCKEHNIENCVTFEELRKYGEIKKYKNKYKLIKKYFTTSERMELQRDFYMKKSADLEKQVCYLINHIDVMDLKAASGYLRKKQIETVDFAVEFIESLSEIEISPFLYSDSLLGCLRYDGFIPWCDEMNFALMERDYNKLYEFLSEKYYMTVYEEDKNENIYFFIDRVTSEHKNENIVFKIDNCMQISIGTSCIDRKIINFHLVNAGNNINFSLKNCQYEQHEFMMPIHAEEFLKNENMDWRKLSINEKSEYSYWKEFKRDNLITVEFYLIDAFEISHFKPFYEYLRSHHIYAIFIAENNDINTSGKHFDYAIAIEMLDEQKLEYEMICNPNADFAFTTQEFSLLRKYSNNTKKINLTYGCALKKGCFWFQERACKGFDYRLVHGNFIKDECSKYMSEKSVKIIGYPRYFGFDSIYIDIDCIRKELGIQTNKPIICYFPTWDGDASISMFRDEFLKLKKDYFIISKPHHCTYRLPDKKADLEILYEISDIVLMSDYELSKAAFIGNINVCDAKSGAALEICYLNKDANLLMLSVQKDLRSCFYTDLFKISEIINSPCSLKNSIEQIIKNDRYKSVRNNMMPYFIDDNIKSLDKLYEEIFI